MSNLQVFNYQETPIRVITIDGDPWWVLVDVCRVLMIKNSRDVAARLDEDEKNTVDLADAIRNTVDLADGNQNTVSLLEGKRGNPNMTVINECGLYSVILRSDKPEAKAFKRWVTHEVLPAIRKLGCYSMTVTEKEPFTNAQRIEVMRIISNCTKDTLPEVLKYCDPTWPVCVPEKAKAIAISMSIPARSEAGEFIKNMLTKYDMKQSDLVKKIGCSKAAVSMYVNGRSIPTEEQWKKIKDVFHEVEQANI